MAHNRRLAPKRSAILHAMRRAATLAALITLTSAGVAAAAGPTIKASVKPDTPKAHSTLKVTAKGVSLPPACPPPYRSTSKRASGERQGRGRCNPHKLPCPKKSTVGSGEVVAKVTFLGRQSVPFTLYLGRRQQRQTSPRSCSPPRCSAPSPVPRTPCVRRKGRPSR